MGGLGDDLGSARMHRPWRRTGGWPRRRHENVAEAHARAGGWDRTALRGARYTLLAPDGGRGVAVIRTYMAHHQA